MVGNLRFSLFYDKSKGIFTTEPREEIDIFKLVKIYSSEFIKGITERISQYLVLED